MCGCEASVETRSLLVACTSCVFQAIASYACFTFFFLRQLLLFVISCAHIPSASFAFALRAQYDLLGARGHEDIL